jgi:hypothetical protein
MNTNNNPFTRHSLTLAATLVVASLLPDFASASSTTSYPVLPDLPGPDIEGETQIVIYLEDGLVQVGRLLYTLDGRPLEVSISDLEYLTLLFVVPPGSGVFVTEDGSWTQLDPSSRVIAFDVFDSSVPESLPGELEFEVALPGQPAPTVPDLVIRPVDPDPT